MHSMVEVPTVWMVKQAVDLYGTLVQIHTRASERASVRACVRVRACTHTHTHTHIHIYIYIYLFMLQNLKYCK